jgi:hypothetical protein
VPKYKKAGHSNAYDPLFEIKQYAVNAPGRPEGYQL